jgi:hypothetical protein
LSIMESIKGDTRMSFGHWRYRLLHWAFNVKDPDPNYPEGTGLAKFLYTHYCPLFHLTNLIALLSPVLLAIKVAVVLCSAAYGAARAVRLVAAWEFLKAQWTRLVPPRTELVERPAQVRSLSFQRIRFVRELARWFVQTPIGGEKFETFWEKGLGRFDPLTEDEARSLYAGVEQKILEARAKAEARRKWVRDRILFWTNFSRVFFKWAMYALYAGLTVGALYLVYSIAGPCWDALCWVGGQVRYLFTDAGFFLTLWEVLKGVLKILVGAGVISGAFYLLLRVGFLRRFLDLAGRGLRVVGYPLYIFPVIGDWLASGWNNLTEFVGVFYQENCPAIVLVSEEEAAVDEAVEKAVAS